MSINIIIKIAGVGMIITILNMILKQSGREDISFFVSFAGLILILVWIMPYISDIFNMASNLFSL